LPPPPPRALPAPLARLDAWLNQVFGSRYNPAYQTGTLVVVLWIVLLLTGLWLLLYYRIGAPWDSVAGLTADPWLGNWVRGLHRYASDAAVVATLVHALRIFLQRRTWGPRTLAWISGLVLFSLVLVSGWTGFVMVWDSFGYWLAVEGARLIDLLPILSEPVRRGFVGDRPVASAFFFLNLFLHVAIPLGLGLVFWLHVSRLARPLLLPPRALGWGLVGALLLLAVAVPVAMAPEADPFRIPAAIPVDWFYAFWMPITAVLSPGASWALLLGLGSALLLVPRWTRPPTASRPAPSRVDTQLCTGCTQCSLDCPFEAITMVPRTDGRAELVARIDAARCVSCGICAGSCAPMGVGPPGRTGRDQLGEVRAAIAAGAVQDRLVAFACEHGAATVRPALESLGVTLIPVECVGNLHTSAIEFVVRAGARCAVALSCPPRDCWSREGPRWLVARIHAEREAELQPRVDRRRVRIAELPAFDAVSARALVAGLQQELARLEQPAAEPSIELENECEAPEDAEEVSR
jgi:ferredoxin